MTTEMLLFDLNCYKNILNNDTYISNIESMKLVLNNTISEFDRQIATKYNLREEFKKYYKYPELLYIEKYKHELYYMYLLELNNKNEQVIWSILSNNTSAFFDKLKKRTYDVIGDTFTLFSRYNENYPNSEENKTFLLQLKAENVPLQSKSALLFSIFSGNSKYNIQKKDYLYLQGKKMTCYDLISLYIRIATIQYAREIAALNAIQNLLNLKNSMYLHFKPYYRDILEFSRNDKQRMSMSYIQSPVFWKDDNIEENNRINNNKMDDNKKEQEDIKEQLEDINKAFQESMDLITPNVSSAGILSTCEDIINEDEGMPIEELLSISDNEFEYKSFFGKFYDDVNKDSLTTELFRQRLQFIIRDYNLNINPKNPIPHNNKEEIDQWVMSYDSTQVSKIKNDSLFSAICTILNGQLMTTQRTTNHIYSRKSGEEYEERKCNTYKFTIQRLREAVSERITEKQLDKYFIDFDKKLDMIINDSDYDENTGVLKVNKLILSYKFLFNTNNTNNTNNKLPKFKSYSETLEFVENIRSSKDRYKTIRKNIIRNDLYYGDDITISVLEEVFKIKFIIIDEKIPKEYESYIGQLLFYKNGNGNENGNNDDNIQLGYISNKYDDSSGKKYTVTTLDENNTKRNVSIEKKNNGGIVFSNLNGYIVDMKNSEFTEKTKDLEDVDCAFLIRCTDTDGNTIKYKNVFNKIHDTFIYKLNQLPEYIYYLIFYYLLWNDICIRKDNCATFWIHYYKYLTKKIQGYNSLLVSNTKPIVNIPKDTITFNIDNAYNETYKGLLNDYFNPHTIPIRGGAVNNNITAYSSNTSDAFLKNKESKLSYYVIVDLELYPGKDGVPLSQKAVLGCQVQYEKIRQSWATLFGIPYRPNELNIVGHVAPSTVKYDK